MSFLGAGVTIEALNPTATPPTRRPARTVLRWLAVPVCVLLIALVAAVSIRPSNDRDWSPDQRVLARAEFDGSRVHVRNIRNIEYRSTTDYDVRHYDATFDLDDLDSAWYIVEHLPGLEGAAHTMVSFGFTDGRYLAISVEVRKEVGEEYSPVLGVFRQYELMYVVADERDVVKLRTNHRLDDVYLYPVRTTADRRRRVLVEMLERANALAEAPEFYNTILSSCTTNIVRHVNTIAPRRVPFSYKILLPAYSDELAFDLGLIDTDLPLEDARRRFHINERALRHADDPAFSQRIRSLD